RPDLAKAFGRIGARMGLFVGFVSSLIFISAGHLLVQAYNRESEVVTLATALMGIWLSLPFLKHYNRSLQA
ncbi:hypothetical protein PZH35_11285, partial [Veillonella atypica]|nr:hypothetical protein [Veillonella atypica]